MQHEGNRERLFYIGDDVHSLCVGATRSGKSRTVVLQSIGLLGLAGESMVISDPKAELFHFSHVLLEKLGYTVWTLDFRHPEKAITITYFNLSSMLHWPMTRNRRKC